MTDEQFKILYKNMIEYKELDRKTAEKFLQNIKNTLHNKNKKG
jgi:hypothetical protein